MPRSCQVNTPLFISPLLLISCLTVACEAPNPPSHTRPLNHVPDASRCPECRLVFHETAVLGSTSDPASIRPDAMRGCMIDSLSTGHFVVSGVVGGGQLLVYPPEGGSAIDTIGRLGQGPGEFGQSVRIISGPGDTLHVIDDANGRLSVVERDGTPVRSFPLPDGYGPVVLLPNGQYLFHTTATAGTDGLFHQIDPEGQHINSFGYPRDLPYDIDQRVIGPSVNDGFWTAGIWEYVVEARTQDSIRFSLARSPDWFDQNAPPPEAVVDEIYRSQPPVPLVRSVWEDPIGRLWVYSQVPDPGWTAGMPVRMSPAWGRNTFDTVVEVIDVHDLAVIVRRRFDELLGLSCQSHIAYAVRETPNGDTRLVVFRPELRGPQ